MSIYIIILLSYLVFDIALVLVYSWNLPSSDIKLVYKILVMIFYPIYAIVQMVQFFALYNELCRSIYSNLHISNKELYECICDTIYYYENLSYRKYFMKKLKIKLKKKLDYSKESNTFDSY